MEKRRFHEECVNHVYQRTLSGFNIFYDVEDYLAQTEEQIANGGEAHALAQDLQNKVNAAAKDTWERFEKKLAEHLEKFYQTHPYEKK